MNRMPARPIVALLLLMAAVAAIAPATQAKGKDKGNPASLTVMTRNLYLGTDLLPIALAPSVPAFEQAATNGFNQVKATNFPARAKLIAREVKRAKPDLIGLQEAALWRTGPKDGTATRAQTVAFDFLEILRTALRQAGVPYAVVQSNDEADIEGPTSEGFDVRLTMRDVVLVRKKQRKGLRLTRRGRGTYDTRLELPTQVGTFASVRGYVYVDGKLAGRRFRFIDTHLEAYGSEIRTRQAQELLAGPARRKGRVILVGDMNSDPDGAEPQAFQALTGAGFVDTWARLYPTKPGLTSGLRADLMDPPSPNPFDDSRIDHVLVKGKIKPLNAKVVGTNPATSRTSTGLWASDHAGVVTKLKLK
jgi:endonuclease/exonuclease/phosphatase family metal-dependent hydrolase